MGLRTLKLQVIKSQEIFESYNHFFTLQEQFFELGAPEATPPPHCVLGSVTERP